MSRLATAIRQRSDGYRLVLPALMLLYVSIFTGMAWRLHAGMRTHKADLGQIDQAIWNSSRGRFVEMTDNGYLATRMSDHVEPILALISPIYWFWNDTRAILLLQALFVAAGAWLLYELTLALFDKSIPPNERDYVWRREPLRALSRPIGLALAAAYLLAPQLQSALLTEFHAAPLAAPLILWALLSIERRRLAQFAAAALLLAAVKEEMALAAAGLGVWAMIRFKIEDLRLKIGQRASREGTLPIFNLQSLIIPAFVTIAALVWFYLATFVIVPAHAAEVYGVAESGYFQRYGALGNSPAEMVRSIFTQPGLVRQIAVEPARVNYTLRLLMAFGFLSLLGPELLLIGLPLFLANLLSAYPAQYYGEFHYSAPLIAYAGAAAALGASRIWRMLARRTEGSSAAFQHLPAARTGTMAAVSLFTNARTALRPLLAAALCIWILSWAGVGYLRYGRGPLGGRYDPTPVTAHHRLLARFVDQIPPDAAVTATAAVHPHVSHRRYVYQFPTGLDATAPLLGNAEWALLDVTANTDMAPGDLYAQVQAMLAGEWGVVDAADGFLLLHKGAPQKSIPREFYDFARTEAPSAASDGPLRVSNVRVEDWPRWRQSRVSVTWTAGAEYDPATDAPGLEIRTPSGEVIYSSAQLTPPALLWYPAEEWQPGEEITVTTLPLTLPRDWGVVTVMGEGEELAGAYGRGEDGEIGEIREIEEIGETGAPMAFVGGGQGISLRGAIVERDYAPGDPVDVRLWWEGDAWPVGMTVFVHLRGPNGEQVQADGLPRYFGAYDADAALARDGIAPDWRQLPLPASAAAGTQWSVVVGLYDEATGERAALADGAGNEATIGRITVARPRTPDQACALNPAACASQ
ncbi:MAG: DUF2079 domain-containing protein [Caldilineaceae bacterium]|nr:DUF2079 domain-containing protein [Caldilineaceae bacterium]